MSKMNLFNFYLDDNDKQAAIEKLDRLCGDTSKGKLAALLRVIIKSFINMPENDASLQLLIKEIDHEYTYTKNKNKRSAL